ncbi:MAG: hypothetical protein AAFY91_18430, partial [Bacteroidota bacterium]
LDSYQFILGGSDNFEVLVTPGLPCHPPTLFPSDQLLNDISWYDIFNNVVGTDFYFTPDAPGQYIFEGTDPFGNCVVRDTFNVSVPECQIAEGTIWIDEGDCTYNGTEIGLAQARLSFTRVGGPPAEVYYTLSDTEGNWSIELPVGQYEIEYDGVISQLYSSCPNQTITIVANTDANPVDVLVNALEDCPRVTIDLAIPFLRRCFENTLFLSYRNTGSMVAQDAAITVELDDFLIFESSTFPANVNGQTLTFDLGDLDPQDGGLIQIGATVSCDADLGQSHCIQATASPNEPCPTPDMAWSGGTVNITTICDDDQSRFEIENIGIGDMTVPLSYIIVEDGVMFREEPFTEDALTIAETVEFILPDPDKSYWIQSNQEPLALVIRCLLLFLLVVARTPMGLLPISSVME